MALLKGTTRTIGRTAYEAESIRLRDELEAAFAEWKATDDRSKYDLLSAAFNERCGTDEYQREAAIANAIKQ